MPHKQVFNNTLAHFKYKKALIKKFQHTNMSQSPQKSSSPQQNDSPVQSSNSMEGK